MTEKQYEGTQPQYRDVTIQKGDWRPNDEKTKKITGIEGVFTTIMNNLYIDDKRLPDRIRKLYLHTDGRVTEEIIDSLTNQKIPQGLRYEKIKGRVELHPKYSNQYVLKYQESLTPQRATQPPQP